MEEFLNAYNKTKTCFESKNLGSLMGQDPVQTRHECFNEKKELIGILMSDKLLTTNLINERLNILTERTNKIAQTRRSFLDSYGR